MANDGLTHDFIIDQLHLVVFALTFASTFTLIFCIDLANTVTSLI